MGKKAAIIVAIVGLVAVGAAIWVFKLGGEDSANAGISFQAPTPTAAAEPTCAPVVINVIDCFPPDVTAEVREIQEFISFPLHPSVAPNFSISTVTTVCEEKVPVVVVSVSSEEGLQQVLTLLDSQRFNVTLLLDYGLIQFTTDWVKVAVQERYGSGPKG